MEVEKTARLFYLNYALQTVRAAELEKSDFLNSLTSIGYAKVMEALKSEKQESIIRDIIGRSAAVKSMENYDSYVYPLVKIAVVRWKGHCLQFNTGDFVTEISVLHQWTDDSLQDLAFIVLHSLQILDDDPGMFTSRKYIDTPFQNLFPAIHAWQQRRDR
jgi:hypothetical protein